MGDYATHAGHLDPLEDCAYRRLIDLYMLTEAPLPLDVEVLARKIRMKDYAAQVRDVLNEFFVCEDDAWSHSRCDKELDKFRRSSEAASKAGKLSALQRKATGVQRAFNGGSTDVQPAKSQEPRAKNQDPEQREANARGLRIPVDFPGPADLDWCESERPDLSAGAVAMQFRDYHLAHGTAMKSWPAAWRTWVRKERQHAAARASPALTALDRQAEVIARITGTASRIINIEGEIERPKLTSARN